MAEYRYIYSDEWNGNQPIVDPNLTPQERDNFIHIQWSKNKIKCDFNNRKLVHAILRHDHADITEIRYVEKEGTKLPVSVMAELPLACLTIKKTVRNNPRSVI